MPVLLALLAALSYGVSDFVGGIASKRTSPWSVAVMAQVAGAAGLALAATVVRGTPDAADLAWAVVAGIGAGVGTTYLYRGLSAGRMGVVAPVSGVGAAAIPVLAGVALGERPSTLVWLGIVLALPSIWLVSQEPVEGPAQGPSGFRDGVGAGLGFGGLFVALAQISPDAGALPLALNQLVGAATIVVMARHGGHRWLPARYAVQMGIAAGVLAAAANLSYATATHLGYTSVAAVITSFYPAFTVLLAMTVLHEHVHRSQAVGLVGCLAAVALVATG